MNRPDLTKLLEQPKTPPPESPAPPTRTAARKAREGRTIHKPGEVNISAYFAPEVKSALRQVQARTGKNIKGCLSEALQLLFRKHNIPVTVPEE
jgi:murein L,D-transpeptidase YcbB/YkuD